MWVIGLVVLLVILGVVGSVTGFLGKRDKGVEVETAQVEVRDITQVVTASGKVQPEIEVKISPDVSGEIIELRVNEGDEIERGTLLVRIKPDFYTAQVEQAQAGVLQSQAALAQRKADMMKAEIDFNRQKDLFDKKVVSEADFQTSQTQYEVAKAAFEAAEYAVQSAEARLRESRDQLNKTTIYAPMTGTVSQLNVELGERVVGTSQMAGTEMMRIAKLDQMEMEVDVNENDVVNVGLGDTASIAIDAYPERTFKGVVTEIANSARITGAGSQEQVTNFPVKVRLLDAHNIDLSYNSEDRVSSEEVPLADASAVIMRPGMSGTVDIFTKTVPNAISIPIQAVTVRDFNKVKADSVEDEEGAIAREDLRKAVFLVDNGHARLVEVETGISDDTHVEVTKGLTGNESIIIGPYSAVSRTLEPDVVVRKKEDDKKGRPGPLAAR